MKAKTMINICFLIVLTIELYAQETEQTRIYEIRSNIPVIPCDVRGRKLYTDGRVFVPRYLSQFALIRALGDTAVLVRFLTWSNPVTEKLYNGPIDVNDKSVNPVIKQTHINGEIHPYYILSKDDLTHNCVKVFRVPNVTFTVGAATMPVKIRYGQNFDFQGTISLGTTAGAKFRISKYKANYLNLLVNASVSTVALDSFSTGGNIKGQPLTNIAVFSPSVGVVLEFGKAQFGIFHGWDLLNKATQSKYDWIYDRKPWLSIGFGLTLFNSDSKPNSSVEQKQGEEN